MSTDRAGVAEDVGHVGRRDPRVERDEHRAGEGHGVVRREHDVRVAGEHRDAIAGLDAQLP